MTNQITRSILAAFSLLLAAMASRGEAKFCNYTVSIETTYTRGSATTNHVSLRFCNARSNDVVVHHLNTKHMRQVDPLEPLDLEGPHKRPFQECTVDEFQVTGPCVESRIYYLYLKSMGSDDWRPGLVQVRVPPDGAKLSSRYFCIRRYLPNQVGHGEDTCDSNKVVTAFGVKNPRKVFVARKKSSQHVIN